MRFPDYRAMVNLVRPLELVLFSIFPLIGRGICRHDIPPLTLIVSSFVLSLAIILDNYIEGVLFHPDDARGGDYPVILGPRFFLFIKRCREFLFLLFFAVTLLFSAGSVLLAVLVFGLVRIYNSRHLLVKTRPPIDFCCHFLGAFIFYLYGCTWQGRPEEVLVLPGLGMAALFSGGYINHLLVDRVRDAGLGIKTLAHRLNPENVQYLAGSIIVAGDIILGVFFCKENLFRSVIFFTLGSSLVIMLFFVRDARAFRRFYRFLHIVGLTLIFASSLTGLG